MEETRKPLLSVKDLRIHFSTDHGYVQAVRGVSFDLYKGETLCIVGESGSGKSVTNKAIMGILSSNGRIVEGSIMYEGEDLTKVSEDEFHRIRGHKIGMIFQDPLSSLNPIVRIGKQITEAMLINGSRTKKMFNDLVADELVAYKNAETELRTGLAKFNENIKFLRSEKKKQIAQAKNFVSNELEGQSYALKREFGAIKFNIEDEFNSKKLEAKGIADEAQRAEFLAKAKEERDAKLSEQLASYNEGLKGVRDNKPELVAQANEKIQAITDKFDKEILDLKSQAKEETAKLKAELLPLIKERKLAYKAKAKEARAKVKEFKKEKRAIYKKELKETLKKDFSKDNKFSFKRLQVDLKKVRDNYISSIKITKAEAKAKALKIMEEVGIKDPDKRFRQYPFEFSGGMRQRIVIAIALTADPDILICDEPTTALDVTIQAQILELINNLKKERQLSCIFITHDLGVVANMADRVAVMYAGKIVEYGTEEEIFYDPRHPYTWALLSSIPDVDSNEKLEAIPGTPPNMIYPPEGDAFALRSKYAMEIDFKKEPPLFKVSDTHYAATWLLDPRAPKVEMPKIVKTRIANSLKAKKGARA